MLADDALRTKPTLQCQLTVLRPLGPEHAEVFWRSLDDPEGRRLTGTHAEFRRDEIDAWLANRSEQHDRLDLSIHRRDNDRYVGELALIDLDAANESVGVRIALTSTDTSPEPARHRSSTASQSDGPTEGTQPPDRDEDQR